MQTRADNPGFFMMKDMKETNLFEAEYRMNTDFTIHGYRIFEYSFMKGNTRR